MHGAVLIAVASGVVGEIGGVVLVLGRVVAVPLVERQVEVQLVGAVLIELMGVAQFGVIHMVVSVA